MDLECTFDNPLPSHVVERTRQVDDRDGRLAKLEDNLARLLEMVERNSAMQLNTQHGGGGSMPTLPSQAYADTSMPEPPPAPAEQSSMHVLAHAADTNPSAFHDLDTWVGPGSLDIALFNDPTPAPAPSGSFSATLPTAWNATGPSRWNDLPVVSTSPNGLADTPHSHHSTKSSAHERHASAQARPIPKYGTASRMAAFTDPLSHEAPFRSLTFNPDTFRNVEMVEDGPDESIPTGSTGVIARGDGGKTPKRGIRDPIDNGVMGESEAKALFTL